MFTSAEAPLSPRRHAAIAPLIASGHGIIYMSSIMSLQHVKLTYLNNHRFVYIAKLDWPGSIATPHSSCRTLFFTIAICYGSRSIQCVNLQEYDRASFIAHHLFLDKNIVVRKYRTVHVDVSKYRVTFALHVFLITFLSQRSMKILDGQYPNIQSVPWYCFKHIHFSTFNVQA